MNIDIMTLFPDMFGAVFSESIIGRAQKNHILDIKFHQIRDFAFDKHKRVDDTPYGGGQGMLMLAEPIYLCFKNICMARNARPKLVYMSPRGKKLDQKIALEYSKINNIAVLCGHYEGVDELLIEEIVDDEISIGDYVLTGGEIPAMAFIDTVSRLVPGVLSENICFEDESYFNNLLEYPQYTKPSEWRGRKVPEVLLSGHHANINAWKKEQSLNQTRIRRPDLLNNK